MKGWYPQLLCSPQGNEFLPVLARGSDRDTGYSRVSERSLNPRVSNGPSREGWEGAEMDEGCCCRWGIKLRAGMEPALGSLEYFGRGWEDLCLSLLHHMTSASFSASGLMSLLLPDAYSKLTAHQHEPQVLPASPADAAVKCRPAWQGVCGEQGKAAAPIPVPDYVLSLNLSFPCPPLVQEPTGFTLNNPSYVRSSYEQDRDQRYLTTYNQG